MFPPVIRKIQSNSTGIKISEALTTSGKDCEELPAPGLDVDHVQHPLLPPPPLHAEAHIPQLEMRILEQPGLPRPTAILEGLQHVGHGAVGGFGEVLVIQDRGIMPRNIIKYNTTFERGGLQLIFMYNTENRGGLKLIFMYNTENSV